MNSISAKYLRDLMQIMFPDVEDGRADTGTYEHPMTAVGTVLLSSAMLDMKDVRALTAFTSYSSEFVSAIVLNMLNNRLWTDTGYDHSEWLREDGIDLQELWQHIEMACGTMRMPNAVTD